MGKPRRLKFERERLARVTPDLEYDPHDPDSVEVAAAYRRLRDEELRQAWFAILSDRRGLLVIADILASTGWNAPSYMPGQPDHTAHMEGRRAIGLALREKILLNYPKSITQLDAILNGVALSVGHDQHSDGDE